MGSSPGGASAGATSGEDFTTSFGKDSALGKVTKMMVSEEFVGWLEECTGLNLQRSPFLRSGTFTQVRAFRQVPPPPCNPLLRLAPPSTSLP